jgi:hypothetical protein
MSVEITIKLRADVARSLHGTAAPSALAATLGDLAAKLEPLHRGATDPLLVPYFRLQAPDLPAAEQIVEKLRKSDAVEAAYVKPHDEAP